MLARTAVSLGLSTPYPACSPGQADGTISNVTGLPVYCTNPTQVQAVEIAEKIFLYLFTGEAVIKIIAMGFFFEQGTYLYDPWNILDFTVVVLGFLGEIEGVENLSGLRTFRVLRPLRALSSIGSE